MVYERKKHGGASCYLVAPDNVTAFIRRVTWAQGDGAERYIWRRRKSIKRYLRSLEEQEDDE